MLAACGRLGFDENESLPPVDAPVDTGPVDCTQLADGTPCDDRNICTATSTCNAGVCGVTSVETGCQVAASEADFDSTQNVNGWFYGFWLAQSDFTYEPDTDFELGVFDDVSGGWIPVDPNGSEFIYLRAFGVHPQFNPVVRMPVRRWVSPVQGPAVVIVTVDKADTSCGDGVEARLVVDGVTKLTQVIEFDDAAGVTLPVSVELVPGTKIDALLSARADEACDTTNYKLVVSSPI